MRFILFTAATALGLLFLTSTMWAHSQGIISASSICGKSEVHQTVAVDDGSQHSISLDKRPCTWEKPIEIGGVPSST
jgi:hypothetical protein